MRDWLTHRARTSPNATALVAAATGEEWTYAELDADVTATAERLAGAGLLADDHLGVLMETRIEFVRLVHAAMRLGTVLVPLNARLTPPELARQREHADLSLLVCEADTESDAVAAAGAVPVASVDPPVSDADSFDALERASAEPVERAREDPLAMLFTSGTTGDPKAVVLSTGNLLASATSSAFRLGVTPEDRWLLCLSMYHMGGLAPVLRATLYGTTLIFQEEFDPKTTAEAMAAYDATGISLVPTMLDRILDAPVDPAPDSLRFVLLGGAPASGDLIDRCRQADVPVYPTYGMTETASQVATATPSEAFEHDGTVGRPLLFTDVTVVDEDGTSVPSGETGELVVSGPTVMQGYYGNPDATANAFGEHGFYTGDVGYRDDGGRVWVLNRREDRIVTGGENVHPGEVADALREHESVRDVAVVGLDDPEWGERVSALVVPEAGTAATAEDLRSHCDERLAGFKRPRTIAFADELPRTASGTVEREAVRERLRDETV